MNLALAQLRESTRALHDRTEAAFGADRLRAGTLQPAAFDRLLRKNHYIYQCVETPLHRASATLAPALRKLLPTLLPALERACHQRDIIITPATEWPLPVLDFTHKEGLYGHAYVLLGSHLGGTVIYRMLRQQPHLVADGGLDFYAALAALPAQRWPRFLKLLATEIRTPEAIAAAEVQAVALFDFFHRVYSHSGE